MRNKFLASIAGTLAVAGLAAALTTTSVAAPGDTAAHLGDVLPGALAGWNGVSGWADTNHDAIAAQGYDPAAVADTTGNDCVTTDPATGAIAVGTDCPAGTDVGAAVGDAAGSLRIQLGDATVTDNSRGATLTFKDPTTQLFTADEALSLVPTIRMTINNDDPKNPTDPPVDYLIDLQNNTITRDPADPTSPAYWNSDNGRCSGTAPGSDCFDALDPVLLVQYPDCALAQVRDGILGSKDSEAACPSEDPGNTPPLPDPYTGPTLVDTLSSGVVKAMRDDVRWGGSNVTMTKDLPISFGYPFAGSLVNGQTGHVQLDKVLANTWLEPLTTDPGLVSTVGTPVDVTTAALSDLLPATAPGAAYSSQIDLSGSLSTLLRPLIREQLDKNNAAQGIWLQTASGLRNGINAGLAWMDGKTPLTHINENYVNSIDFTPVPTSDAGPSGVIYQNLMKLSDTKVAEWYPLLQLSGPLTLTYTPGPITSLTATDVTVTAPSESPTPSDTPTESATPSATPSDDASGWAFPSSPANLTVTEPSSSASPTASGPGGSGFCQDTMNAITSLQATFANVDLSSGPSLIQAGQQFGQIAQDSDTPAEAVDPLTTLSMSLTALGTGIQDMDINILNDYQKGAPGLTRLDAALAALVSVIQDNNCQLVLPSGSPTPGDSSAPTAPSSAVSSVSPSVASSAASQTTPNASSSTPETTTPPASSSAPETTPAASSTLPPTTTPPASNSTPGSSTPASSSVAPSSSNASTAGESSTPVSSSASGPSSSVPPADAFCPLAGSAYQEAIRLLNFIINGTLPQPEPDEFTTAGDHLKRYVLAAPDTPAEADDALLTVGNWFTQLGPALAAQDQTTLPALFAQATTIGAALDQLNVVYTETCVTAPTSVTPGPSWTAPATTTPASSGAAPASTPTSTSPAGATTPASTSPAPASTPTSTTPRPTTPASTTPPATTTAPPSTPTSSSPAPATTSNTPTSPAPPSTPGSTSPAPASTSPAEATTPASTSPAPATTSNTPTSATPTSPAPPSTPTSSNSAPASTSTTPSSLTPSAPSSATTSAPPIHDVPFCQAYAAVKDALKATIDNAGNGAVWTRAGDVLQVAAAAADAPSAAVEAATVLADYYHAVGTAITADDKAALNKLYDQGVQDQMSQAVTQLTDAVLAACSASTSPQPSSPAATTPSSPQATSPSASTPAATTPPPTSTAPSTTPPPTSTAPSTTPPPTSTAPSTQASSTRSPASTTPPATSPAPSSPAATKPTASTPAATTPPPSTTTPTTPPASSTAPKKASVTVSPANATLTLVNGQLQAPVTMTATGTGFQPGERVTGVMNSTPLPLEPAQTADPQGNVTFTWQLPVDIAAGQHSVVLTGDTTGPVEAAAFTVTRVDTTAPPTGPATAAPSDTITVTQAGMTLTVKGTGFAPGDTVKGTIVKVTGSTTTPLATLTAAVADASGNVTFTWTMPAGTASGTYAITMTGSNGHSQSKQFTLTAAKDGGVTLSGTGPGPETNVVGVLGLLAIAVGAASVLGTLLRRRTAAR